MRNYRYALLENSTRIPVVSHINRLVVEHQHKRGASSARLQRILFHGALNPKSAVWFTTRTLPNLVNVAIEVNSRGEELRNNEPTGRYNYNQHGHIFPLAIALSRREWRVVRRRARS